MSQFVEEFKENRKVSKRILPFDFSRGHDTQNQKINQDRNLIEFSFN